MHVISMKATLLLLIVPPYQLGLSLRGKNYFLYESAASSRAAKGNSRQLVLSLGKKK